jgi:hypothetical protein
MKPEEMPLSTSNPGLTSLIGTHHDFDRAIDPIDKGNETRC